MAGDALARRATAVSGRSLLRMAALTKTMELLFQQWPHFRISHMAGHAEVTTGLVDVVVVTIDATNGSVVFVCEAHWQNRLGCLIVLADLGMLRNKRRPKDIYPCRYDRRSEDCRSHSAKFRTAENTPAPTTLINRNNVDEAIVSRNR